jgi:ATP-binding cassette, subfamily B, bacterial CvaB/MchF/RaxB
MTNLFQPLQRLGKHKHLPVLLQTEAAECGLVCLAMVARYHGHDIDLSAMRRRFPISLKGSTLSYLIKVAEHLHFNTRPLRIELEYLPHLQTPCLIHWNLNHMVVMKEFRAGKIVIHDPAFGLARYSPDAFSKHFTGVVLELTPAQNFQPIQERQSISIRALTGQVQGFKRALVRILLLSAALEVFVLISPLLIQSVMDQVLVSGDNQLLLVLAIGFTALILFQACATAFRGWMVAWLSAY